MNIGHKLTKVIKIIIFPFSVGKIKGIDIRLHTTLILLWYGIAKQGFHDAGVTGAIIGLLIGISAMIIVLLHELGHCWMASSYGYKTSQILLTPFGGAASINAIERITAYQEFKVALAGPAVNIIGVVFLFPFFSSKAPLYTGLGYINMLLIFNIAMTCFNLLPVFPMDGGRVLRSLLTPKLGKYRATKVSVYIASILAVIMVVAAWHYNEISVLVIMPFVLLGGFAELNAVRKMYEQHR